ncbi:MAG: hypothetical protein GY822_12755 [Deltaproteobacteria bacterium]|nr:hypothetical protein [Deltaproteobacteria bacterium]
MDHIQHKSAIFDWRRIHAALEGSSPALTTENSASNVKSTEAILRTLQQRVTSFFFASILCAASVAAFFTKSLLPSSSLLALLGSMVFLALLVLLPPLSARPKMRVLLLGVVFFFLSGLLATYSAWLSVDFLFLFLAAVVVGEASSLFSKRAWLIGFCVSSTSALVAFSIDVFHPIDPLAALSGTGLALFLLTGSRLADDAISHRHPTEDRLDATLTRFSEALRTLLFWALQGLGALQETESS